MDHIIPQREWEAQEKYLRYQSHADALTCLQLSPQDAHDAKIAERAARWQEGADMAYAEWQALIKERESK